MTQVLKNHEDLQLRETFINELSKLCISRSSVKTHKFYEFVWFHEMVYKYSYETNP